LNPEDPCKLELRAWNPKRQLRFNFNTLLLCPGLWSQLRPRNSLYFLSPLIVWRRVCCVSQKLLAEMWFQVPAHHLQACLAPPGWYEVLYLKPQEEFLNHHLMHCCFLQTPTESPYLQIWCILTGWNPKSNKVQIILWSSLMSFQKMTHINNRYHIW